MLGRPAISRRASTPSTRPCEAAVTIIGLDVEATTPFARRVTISSVLYEFETPWMSSSNSTCAVMEDPGDISTKDARSTSPVIMALGNKLVSNSIEQAYSDNWNWVVLVGDIGYYSKFGFSKNPTFGISLGDGIDNERLLGLDIKESFLNEAIGSLIKAN